MDDDLATKLVDELFALGSEPSWGDAGMVQRIAFKGGTYLDYELDMGGLCREALILQMRAWLRKHQVQEKAA